MYVYGNNYENVDTTMLLYPKHLDVIEDEITLGNNKNKVELKMRSINLDFSSGYDEYIEEIKKRLGNIC